MPKMIHMQLAVQIVETLKSICDHDINYISPSEKIYASTDESRIGEFHEAGYQAAKSGEIMIIEELFDMLDLEILLASASPNAKDVFLEKCLKNLTEEDVELLNTYFACGQSLKMTSEKLFMHINTLQYRLNRIHERCGYQPRIFQDAVVLYAALKLRRIMRG